jgi:hypothetical protein
MSSPRAINMALDLARMPEFAASMSMSQLPPGIIEVIRIAAMSPEECKTAALANGVSEAKLVQAAQFYLQQVLFNEGADCHRILGVRPGESRALARDHMRWLLRWLHPDRNGNWDSVYARRILEAWREVSAGPDPIGHAPVELHLSSSRAGPGRMQAPRLMRRPWIAQEMEKSAARYGWQRWMSRFPLKIATALAVLALIYFLTMPASTLDVLGSLIAEPLSNW